MRKLMHYQNNSDAEQMVWLVWELVKGRNVLAVICTTDRDLSRYVTPDRKYFLGGDQRPAFCEKVMCDHLYGSVDRNAAIAMNLIRRS